MPQRVFNLLKDFTEIGLVYASSFLVSLNLVAFFECLEVANQFFEHSKAIWQTASLVPAVIYMLIKIRHEKSKNNNNRNSGNDSE